MTAFLFAPESPRPWAVMRVLLAAALLWETTARWPYCVELYSSAGQVFPAFPSSDFQPFPLNPLAILVLHSALVAMLVSLLIGWYSRICAVLAAILIGGFALLDAAGTLTKYTAISLHLLFLMSFAQPGGVWSIDAWRRRRQGRAVPLTPAWPRWLIGMLVASIYLGAAVTKIRLPDFATGDLLEFSLLDDAYGGRGIGLWLATRPKLLVLSSYTVIAFELLLPVLIWVPRLRRVMLIGGALFHVTLALMMHLAIFTPVMLAALCVFLKESDLRGLQNLFHWFRRKVRGAKRKPAELPEREYSWKSAWINFGLFGLTLGGSIAVLTAYQYHRDPYGVFHRRVEVRFSEVEKEQAYEMIDAFEPDYRDYFHRIEIGSRLGYRRVYGEKKVFQPSQVVYVMARLLKPHPSWELTWELIAPKESNEEESPRARYGRRLDASNSYASIGFQLKPEFPEGHYRIRLTVGERFGPQEVVKEIPFELVKKE